MTEYPAKRSSARCPTHPGSIIRFDVIPASGMTVNEVAAALGVSRQALHNITRETSAVSPEMAIKLGKFCGNGPLIWMRMQEAHDLWKAAKKLGDKVNEIPTLEYA